MWLISSKFIVKRYRDDCGILYLLVVNIYHATSECQNYTCLLIPFLRLSLAMSKFIQSISSSINMPKPWLQPPIRAAAQVAAVGPRKKLILAPRKRKRSQQRPRPRRLHRRGWSLRNRRGTRSTWKIQTNRTVTTRTRLELNHHQQWAPGPMFVDAPSPQHRYVLICFHLTTRARPC